MIIKNILKIMMSAFILTAFSLMRAYAMTAQEAENIPKLRQGTFLKIMPLEEFSTLTADIEDEVKFINTYDMYVYEINAVPAGTIFYGEIEDLKEPVQGRDGSLKVLINKMITPDKKVYKIKAHLYGENGGYIGGNTTQSIYYHRVPHYTQAFKPMLQAAPLNVYEQGRHISVKPGEEFFMIIDEDIILK